MNEYVDNKMTAIRLGNTWFAKLVILQPDWVTDFKIAHNNKFITPTFEERDGLRAYYIPLDLLQHPLQTWVKVDIEAIHYHHDYYTTLVAKGVRVPETPQEPEGEETSQPEKPNEDNPLTSIDTTDDETKRAKEQPIETPSAEEKKKAEVALYQPVKVTQHPMTKAIQPVAQVEEQVANLVFDRTKDEHTKPEEMTTYVAQDLPVQKPPTLTWLDYTKIIGGIMVFIASGVLLVIRLRKRVGEKV